MNFQRALRPPDVPASAERRDEREDGMLQRFNLEGKVVVVTGGGTGLGLAICEKLILGTTLFLIVRVQQLQHSY